jgi:hypothetical protein
VKVTVQILQHVPARNKRKVLHSFAHSGDSLRVIKDSLRAVFYSEVWPADAHAFRVLANNGTELCYWPGTIKDSTWPDRMLAA